MASGDTKTEALLNILGSGGDASEYRGCCNTKSQSYILDAIDRVQKVEDDVEEIKNNPDVVDIVATYADLQAYDTQHLTDNDIIRVLQDETHNDNSTYYRFTKNPDTWTFIGEFSGGGPTVVQTTGNSTTDVMSQNATTTMVFNDPSDRTQVQIGAAANASGQNGPVAIGNNARATGAAGVALGRDAWASGSNSIALGRGSFASAQGEFNVGAPNSTRGYNNSQYRLLTGVHDPVSAHDAATKGYVDAHSGGGGVTLYIDTELDDVLTNGSGNIHIYSDSGMTEEIDNEQFDEYVAAGESINFKYYDDSFKVIHVRYDGVVGSVSFIGGNTSQLTHQINISFNGTMAGTTTFGAEALEYQFM